VPDKTVSVEGDRRCRPQLAAARTRLLEWTARLTHPPEDVEN